MVLEITRLVLQIALLTCALVGAWYAYTIHTTHARGIALLDAHDVERRRALAEDARARESWRREINSSLREARALLEQLYELAAEHEPHVRDTHITPPPTLVPLNASGPAEDRASDSDVETRCMDKGDAHAALAAASSSSSPPETVRKRRRE